ncbi:nuclear transport factor 2 family protein [Glaciibacter flavus]|uniref:Nuclear transport factor 2 family protein n=1 Tax=Orlajensenia flava TaxID=2565934 RepID=A0A4S4FXI6_9MICO|nr:nuclear transport factor 2 family protein [Glaciibacter flavus]THG34396.1 nuclear transport factor 2 family protein [Glaciibacter flavus]
MSESTESVARQYIEAVGRRDLAPLDALFDEGMEARFAGSPSDKKEWTEALRRLLPILVRNDIREVFSNGSRACVVYDFVTDTSAGAIPCVELVSVVDGRITEVELILDRVAFAPVREELGRRTAQQ